MDDNYNYIPGARIVCLLKDSALTIWKRIGTQTHAKKLYLTASLMSSEKLWARQCTCRTHPGGLEGIL